MQFIDDTNIFGCAYELAYDTVICKLKEEKNHNIESSKDKDNI